ncbi:LptF/LptG family permease [Winogradskyella poriferorum]|uniref:LptF/LptG family permease n=1 Tax=Winogradskyella poriferorum TaxID=307627 RepID=A0ABU7W699_9FLAO
MKILDRYILITFLRTFFSVFIIFMFIFVLQGVWLYISELAGKDLDVSVTAKFILYYMPKLIPLVVPLTILLSSIMVFGNFAENYEFAAMKSTGISLQRAMRSLSVFIVALGIACFFFANNVIPWGEYNFYNLRKNIAKVKPALAIAEGQFNEIGNINIKVDKKSGDRGQYLENVIIHDKSSARTGNYKVIVSEKGELKSSKDSNVLQLELLNGNYYEEIIDKDIRKNINRPHAKSYFDSYTINVDLEILNDEDLDEKNYKGKHSMLNIDQLNYTIDSLKGQRREDYKTLSNTLYNRTTYAALNLNINTEKDSSFTGNVIDLFPASKKGQIINLALNSANSTNQIIDSNKKNFETKSIHLNKHIIAFHEKFVLAIACIILFFVGAPLGALIRKGGLGLPIVIAVVLFLTYHFFGIFAKNSAEKGSFSPIIGSWLSTAVMLPLSIYLTSRATNDKGAFEIESILKPLKKFFKLQKNEIRDKSYLDKTSEDYKTLLSFENSKLIQIVKNHRDFDYKYEHKNSAISILNERGITVQELRLAGHLSSRKDDEIISLKNEYEEDSKLAFIFYIIMTPLIILAGVFNNNGPQFLAFVFFIPGILAFLICVIALIKSISKHIDLFKALGKSRSANGAILYFLGLPLYFIFYFVQKNQIETELFKVRSKEVSREQLSENSQRLLKDYKDYSNTSLVSYLLSLVFIGLHFILKNNKLPEIAESSLSLGFIALVFFIIYAFVDAYFYLKFYKSTSKKGKHLSVFILIILSIVYPLRYILTRNKIKQDFG